MKRFLVVLGILAALIAYTVPAPVYAETAQRAWTVASKSISAQNEYSDAKWLSPGKAILALSGTWSATVTVQVATDGNSENSPTTWVNVDTFTANIVTNIEVGAPSWWRFGVATGNYTSGTVVGVLLQ